MAECPKVAFPFRGRWQPEGLTEEVVLLEEISQTVDTAGGPTSSGPPAAVHLPLKGKAWMRQPPFLFPVPCSLFPLYFPLGIRKHLDKSEFVTN